MSKTLELTKKLMEMKRKYKELESSSQAELSRLKTENVKLLKQITIQPSLQVEDKQKEVLRLYAFGYAPGNIHHILTTEKNIQTSLEEIQLIVDKIDVLKPDMYRFYLESKQDFKDRVSIDSGFFKSAIYKKYTLLETVQSVGLARAREVGDDALILKYADQLAKLYEKMSNTFFKNGVELEKDKSVEEIMSDYGAKPDEPKEKPKNVVKFKNLQVM